jgi:23S rRNA-/tRNA-specific pseudouridylate synthase
MKADLAQVQYDVLMIEPMPEAPKIIALTAEWLVVDKPAGWLSVAPSDRAASPDPVVLDWARALGEGDILPVHRLDRETSGVLLLARSADAHRKASRWFEKHEVRKLYHLLGSGPAPAQPTLKRADPVGGKPATTLIEIRERFGEKAFLAFARPLTGRRHQIRLHLKALERPLLGDREYGGDPAYARVALHAARLELPGGESFESPWPEDFSAWVDALRSLR